MKNKPKWIIVCLLGLLVALLFIDIYIRIKGYDEVEFLFWGFLCHFLADLSSHRRKMGKFIFLHCLLYAIFFIPLFWWLEVNFLWLFLLFFSHLIIDSQWKKLLLLFDAQTKKQVKLGKTSLIIFTTGLDQILHLLMVLVIALFTF